MESLQTINNETNDLKKDEIKAEEKLNQRREARRRKILENAKNRLERLNGRATTTTTTIDSPTLASTMTSDSFYETNPHQHINGPNHLNNVEFSDPEVEPDIPQQMLQNEPLIMGDLFSTLNAETTIPQQKRHIFLRSRLHLVLSALLACVLTFIPRDTNSMQSSDSSSYSVFIPAGLCVVIDLLFFREQQPLNPMINMVLALFNIRLPSQTKNILHVITIIQSLFIDLGVFIFSFCIFSCGLVCMNYRFMDRVIIK